MRYKLHGPWRHHDTVGPISIDVADLIEPNGHVWPAGAYKVYNDNVAVKVFKGETAWSDAARLANDLYYEWRLNR